MALLTADDVLNKKFQYVKFREGYDQIEVDEFLDEVVATIYSLTVENTELKEELEAANRRIAELSAGGAESTSVEAPQPVPVQAEQPVVEAPVVTESGSDSGAATSMLALAQRLHDEYVEDGRVEGERVIAEAHVQREQIIEDANKNRDHVLADLSMQQQELERNINNLRQFEEDYRQAISAQLEGLLSQVGRAPTDLH